MKNLKISTRLFATFFVVLALMLMLLLLGITKVTSLQRNLNQVVNENEVRIRLATNMLVSVQNISRYVRDVALLKDKASIEKELISLKHERAIYDQNALELKAHIVTPEGLELFERINSITELARSSNNTAIRLALNGQKDEATNILMGQAFSQVSEWKELLTEFQRLQEKRNKKSVDDANSESRIAKIEMYVIGTLTLLISVVLATWITRSIIQPLNFAIKVTERVADGNLATEIDGRRSDELGHLLKALADMQEKLTTVVETVRNGAEGVAHKSCDIATGNVQLSTRTKGQASALEQTAAAMEEVNAAVQRNAAGANEAQLVAQQASQVAHQGGKVVAEVVDTMRSINESSRQISDIVGLIDSIAFQTNILALNAAVEAARAGEHGKGFAVVATEVRSLAVRSAGAAREIKALIDASVERVEFGAELVDNAGKTMTEVVRNIELVNAYVERITNDSNEQSLSVSQVKEAISQLDNATQQNATLASGMSNAASSLQNQAGELVRSVSFFNIKARPLLSDCGLA